MSKVSRGQVLARHASFRPQRCDGKTAVELARHSVPDDEERSETDSCVCNANLYPGPWNATYNALAEQVLGHESAHAVDELHETYTDEADEISESISYLVGLVIASDDATKQQWLLSETKRLDREDSLLDQRVDRCGLTSLTLAHLGRLRSRVDRVVREAQRRQMRDLTIDIDDALHNLANEAKLVYDQTMARLERVRDELDPGALQRHIDHYSASLSESALKCEEAQDKRRNTHLAAFLIASCLIREALEIRAELNADPVFRDID